MSIIGRYIIVDGIKTYYETNEGPADKATIVCLHTAGRDTRQYHEMMELLSDRYRMVAFDMPAHGKSWPLPGNLALRTHQAFGGFIWKFIQEMGIGNPVLVGCSINGYMVYYMAQNYPVRAIVSMEGLDYRARSASALDELMDHPYISTQHQHYEYNESLIGSKASTEAREFILWGVRSEIGIAKRADLGILYEGLDLRDGQSRVTCPVLIIRGKDDWSIPREREIEVVGRLTNAAKVDYKEFEGCGHFIMTEAPVEMAKTVDEFLSSVLTDE